MVQEHRFPTAGCGRPASFCRRTPPPEPRHWTRSSAFSPPPRQQVRAGLQCRSHYLSVYLSICNLWSWMVFWPSLNGITPLRRWVVVRWKYSSDTETKCLFGDRDHLCCECSLLLMNDWLRTTHITTCVIPEAWSWVFFISSVSQKMNSWVFVASILIVCNFMDSFRSLQPHTKRYNAGWTRLQHALVIWCAITIWLFTI